MTSVAGEDPWLERLQGDVGQRNAAVAELRELILRGLSQSMSHRYGSGLNPEDVVQEALIRILDSLDKFEGRSRFTTWAMTIATRIGISELRRKHFQDVSLDSITFDDSLGIELAVHKDSPSGEQLDRRKITQLLQELIETSLTDRQNLAIRRLLEGLSVEEVARRTGSNRNAVYKLFHDARVRLRAGFERVAMRCLPEGVQQCH